jgi:hypothetical protein
MFWDFFHILNTEEHSAVKNNKVIVILGILIGIYISGCLHLLFLFSRCSFWVSLNGKPLVSLFFYFPWRLSHFHALCYKKTFFISFPLYILMYISLSLPKCYSIYVIIQLNISAVIFLCPVPGSMYYHSPLSPPTFTCQMNKANYIFHHKAGHKS